MRTPLTLQDTEIMRGRSRPDVTARSNVHEEMMLWDITSERNRGHILLKRPDWLTFPHVAEVLYPAVAFDGTAAPRLTATEQAHLDAVLQRRAIKARVERFGRYLKGRDRYYTSFEDQLDIFLRVRSGSVRRKPRDFTYDDRGLEVLRNQGAVIWINSERQVTRIWIPAYHVTTEGAGLRDEGLFPQPSRSGYLLTPHIDRTRFEPVDQSWSDVGRGHPSMDDARERAGASRLKRVRQDMPDDEDEDDAIDAMSIDEDDDRKEENPKEEDREEGDRKEGAEPPRKKPRTKL